MQTGESFLSSQPSIAGQLASGEQVAIETELGRLDVVQGLDGVPLSRSFVLAPRAAGRTRDLADLEDLESDSLLSKLEGLGFWLCMRVSAAPGADSSRLPWFYAGLGGETVSLPN